MLALCIIGNMCMFVSVILFARLAYLLYNVNDLIPGFVFFCIFLAMLGGSCTTVYRVSNGEAWCTYTEVSNTCTLPNTSKESCEK